MRAARARARLAVPLVAALLAGCQVDVDGAPCSVPGTTTDCPGGQACGNERRCSARAAGCLATRCTPGTGGACLDPSGVASGAALVRRCTAADAACGAWVVESCAGQGLVCGARAGVAACECPQAGWELVVRPDGGPAGEPPFATGAAAPTACAFRSVADAMASAAALRTLDPGHAVTVTLAGAPAGGTATFPTTSSLVVNRGVTIRADPASAGTHEIVTGSWGSSVLVHDGASLQGVTVRTSRLDGRSGIDVYGSRSAQPVRLSSVSVVGPGAGGGQGGSGLWVERDSVVLADDLHVRDFAGAGLLVDGALASTGLVSITGASITGCGGAGALVQSGRLVLDGVRVAGNAGRGVHVEPLDASTVAVEIRRSRIVGNGDTGVALVGSSELRVSGTTVFGNGASTEWGGAAVASGTTRRAGGVVLSGVPPPAGALELRGNRIYGNRGDQLLALGPATATWNLDQVTCLEMQVPLTNMIGCYDPTPAGTTGAARGIVAIDAAASALGQWWERGVPSSLDAARLPAGTIAVTPACLWTYPWLVCGSEDPPP